MKKKNEELALFKTEIKRVDGENETINNVLELIKGSGLNSRILSKNSKLKARIRQASKFTDMTYVSCIHIFENGELSGVPACVSDGEVTYRIKHKTYIKKLKDVSQITYNDDGKVEYIVLCHDLSPHTFTLKSAEAINIDSKIKTFLDSLQEDWINVKNANWKRDLTNIGKGGMKVATYCLIGGVGIGIVLGISFTGIFKLFS